MSERLRAIFRIACVAALCAFHPSSGKSANGFSVVYSFKGGSDGEGANGGVIVDKSGNIYGATTEGGSNDCGGPGCGTIYKVAPDGGETVLHAFNGAGDGSNPSQALTLSRSGDLYGTAILGGSNGCYAHEGCGTAFKLPVDGTFSVLHTFAGDDDGYLPDGPLLRVGRHAYFGTTAQGGGTGCYSGFGCGTIYRITDSGEERLLHSFGDGGNGGEPQGQLIEDSGGNLYGTAFEGGIPNCVGGCGTVFKLAPDGALTVLHTFHGIDGQYPIGGVVMDAAGNLYGAANEGGQNGCFDLYEGYCGNLFRLAPDGALTVLHSFTGYGDGALPNGALSADLKGNLYGTAYIGGDSNCRCGTVFKLSPGGKFKVLHQFTHGDGYFPLSGLTNGRDGYLYGTTLLGGSSDAGVVFKIRE